MSGDRYPRTCKGKAGPHVISGPEDEVLNGAGRLTCAACARIAVTRYRRTSKGRATHARVSARYVATPKGRATKARANARYDATSKGRATKARYATTSKGRAAKARYDATPKGSARHARYRTSTKGLIGRWTREAQHARQAVDDMLAEHRTPDAPPGTPANHRA